MLSEAVRGIIARGAFAAALSIAAGGLQACELEQRRLKAFA
jgi:Na+(H+)/acetate symporter ActP